MVTSLLAIATAIALNLGTTPLDEIAAWLRAIEAHTFARWLDGRLTDTLAAAAPVVWVMVLLVYGAACVSFRLEDGGDAIARYRTGASLWVGFALTIQTGASRSGWYSSGSC